MLSYSLLVTGPAYGTQAASSAYQFALALIDHGYRLESVFFYREGVSNANQLTAPASDEFDLVRAWQRLAREQGVLLHVCMAAALRRGIVSAQEAKQLGLPMTNLQREFRFSGLGALAEAMLFCDRIVQF